MLRTRFFWIGLLVGIFSFVIVRLFLYDPHITHYHANMAIFIDGKMVDLSDEKYMEDVEACKPSYITQIEPEERTHLHNGEDHVVHVHEKGVTWGHFFANIDWVFGEGILITDDGTRFFNQGNKTLKFLVNGKSVRNPFNTLIASEDRLLISYGSETESQVQSQFEQVEADAHEHNEHPDPGSCSGATSLGWWDHFQRAVLD